MEETIMLILLVLVMLIGSYIAGSIPLIVNLSEEKLKRITVFGAGLLVGTALAVIIPEGIRSLTLQPSHNTEIHNSNTVDVSINHVHETEHNDPHDSMSVIGVSLVLGFVFMLLVDQISINRNASKSPSERNITATIGLVVHAAADGVALGAAATTSHADVEIIVFLAIMLHKAPAAFGLVTFLLHEGIDRQRIRKHLLVFSLAAPTLTLITYFGIGQEGKEKLSSFNATGIAMLFSAGTFLYVATVHVLAELTQNPHHHSTHSHLPSVDPTISKLDSMHHSNSSALRCSELIILVIGCITPLFLTLGHHH